MILKQYELVYSCLNFFSLLWSFNEITHRKFCHTCVGTTIERLWLKKIYTILSFCTHVSCFVFQTILHTLVFDQVIICIYKSIIKWRNENSITHFSAKLFTLLKDTAYIALKRKKIALFLCHISKDCFGAVEDFWC